MKKIERVLYRLVLPAVGVCAAVLGVVSTQSTQSLNASQIPIVIGHRGASGARPEHTLEAYQLAIDQGADFIEPDLVPTKDGVLIARHENLINGTTDVSSRPEFANRATTKFIDGVRQTGWFTEDFTLAEIKTLRAIERIPAVRPQNTAFNGQFQIPTLAEVIALVKRAEAQTGRKIGIYPETKHPTYFAEEGIRLDGRRINTSLGRLLIRTLVENNFTDPSRVFIQSFEFANLIELQNQIMPRAGVDLPLVQLYGDVTDAFLQPDDNFSRPYDMIYNAARGRNLFRIYGTLNLVVRGGIQPTTGYGDLISRPVLTWVRRNYAEGIGPWKNSFLLRTPINPPVDGNGDGRAEITSRLTGEVAPFLGFARRLGFQIHPYTLRSEEPFLTLDASGRPQTITDEIVQLLNLGVSGFFIDQPNDGVAGRAVFLQSQQGR